MILYSGNIQRAYLHTRYGRVGHVVASNLEGGGNIDDVVRQYNKTYAAKTSNAKGYKPIEMKVGSDSSTAKATLEEGKDDAGPKKYAPSRLDKRV